MRFGFVVIVYGWENVNLKSNFFKRIDD